jgi:hypothetical protein
MTNVMPTREPSPVEELMGKSIEKKFPKLMASQSGSSQGITDIVHVPGKAVFGVGDSGSFKITCDPGTGNKVLAALNLHGITGTDSLGRDELYVDAAALARALDVSAEFGRLLGRTDKPLS